MQCLCNASAMPLQFLSLYIILGLYSQIIRSIWILNLIKLSLLMVKI